MKKNIRKWEICVLTVTVLATLLGTGCKGSTEDQKVTTSMQGENFDESVEYETETYTSSQITTIVVGNTIVYLDEVMYYAMTTQATYETYYIAEKETLNWNSKVDGVTLKEAAKSKLLDDICRRESLIYMASNSEYSDKFDLQLTDDEVKEAEDKVTAFYEGTSQALLDRIDITKDRLRDVFIKDQLYKKLLEEAEDAGLDSEKLYKTWKQNNSVATLEAWDEINFETPIFEETEEK